MPCAISTRAYGLKHESNMHGSTNEHRDEVRPFQKWDISIFIDLYAVFVLNTFDLFDDFGQNPHHY